MRITVVAGLRILDINSVRLKNLLVKHLEPLSHGKVADGGLDVLRMAVFQKRFQSFAELRRIETVGVREAQEGRGFTRDRKGAVLGSLSGVAVSGDVLGSLSGVAVSGDVLGFLGKVQSFLILEEGVNMKKRNIDYVLSIYNK
jgi:hypothetical protein